MTVNLLLPTAGLCFCQTTTLKDQVVERVGGEVVLPEQCVEVQQINAYMVAECYNRLLLQKHM